MCILLTTAPQFGPGTQWVFNNSVPNGCEDERMNLPLLTSFLVLYIPSIRMMFLPATGPLHVLFPLREMLRLSSPSPSLSSLPAYSYPFFRSQHEHPSA